MSHIATAPRTGRTGFGALPLSHTRSDSSGSHDGAYEYDGHSDRRYEEQRGQRYDRENVSSRGRHYSGSIESSNEGESPPSYSSGQSWSNGGLDYAQVSTSYKPDMITSEETPLDVALMLDRERPNYKPSALRWPFLTLLLFVILALLGLMVWALHVLPVLNNDLKIITEGIHKRDVQTITPYIAVQIESTDDGFDPVPAPAPLVGRTENASEPTFTPTSSEITTPTVAATPSGGDFGHVGDQTVSEVGDVSTITTITPPPSPTPTGPTSDTSSKTSSRTTIAYSKPESDYGKIGGSVTISESVATDDYGEVGTKTVTEEGTSTTGPEDHGKVGTVTISEKVTTTMPQTPTFVTPTVTVLTDSEGVATSTSTDIPAPVSTPQTTTLTDSQGKATATQETTILVTPSLTTETDSSGIATATITLYPVIPPPPPPPSDDSDSDRNSDGTGVVMKVYKISHAQYFIGSFLPTMLAIALAIPVRILDVNAKILQPWSELAHERGASGRESLCLNTSGLRSVVASARSLLGGQTLVFLTTVLVLASSLLIPVSAEAVKFDLRGIGCVAGGGSGRNCAYVLSVFDQAAKATAALLALMGAATLMLLVILVRWRSGLSTNPWSICGIASLALNQEVRRLFTGLPAGVDAGKMPKGLLESVLKDRWFKLGYFHGTNGTLEYGIMVCEEKGHGDGYTPGHGSDDVKEPLDHHAALTEPKHHLPFLMLGIAGRGLFLFVLCGLLGLILYYNNTGDDTAFEHFMDSESFGVRFLFTTFGVIISFFWASFFSSIAILSPYQLIAKKPQLARRSILLAPPTNAFSGLWSSVRRRHGYLAVVALTSILSEFLTIFLSNIPFRVTQTFVLHQACTWSAVGILCVMVLVVVASFFMTWPHMPVDPSTVAGAMYYVCDSWMLSRFEGLSTLKRKNRDWLVNEMGLKYEFGEIRGVSGTTRIGVDASSSGGMGWA